MSEWLDANCSQRRNSKIGALAGRPVRLFAITTDNDRTSSVDMKRARGRPRKHLEKKDNVEKEDLPASSKAVEENKEEPKRRRSSRIVHASVATISANIQPTTRRGRPAKEISPEDEGPPILVYKRLDREQKLVQEPINTETLITNFMAQPVATFIEGSEKRKKFVTRKKGDNSVLMLDTEMPALTPAPVDENLLAAVRSKQQYDRKIKQQMTILQQLHLIPRPESPDAQLREEAMLLLPDEVVKEATRKKRIKLSPQERILLAQLHHDNFLLFHSPRYTRHHYIYPNSNLRRILLEEWAERLTELGTFHRTAEDVEDRLGEMILEVAEYRRHMETPYRLQMVGIQSSPSFLLVNKVFDYISVENEDMERALDDYEMKLNYDRYVEILNAVKDEDTIWSKEEQAALLEHFKADQETYNQFNLLRQGDYVEMNKLLSSWISQNKKLTGKTTYDLERQIYLHRVKDYQHLKLNGPPFSSKDDRVFCEGWIEKMIDVDLSSCTIPNVCVASKNFQHELVVTEKARVKPRTQNIDVPKLQSFNPIYEFSLNSCRTNRPHMSRRERHLLAMLYRKNHGDYELFNAPHVARKNSINKKWSLLKEWAELLTTLGVSQREPEELATKISQYKNIVKNHRQAEKNGIQSVFLKSEYKLRRIQRPLSPTTKLFDLTDQSQDFEATEDKIKAYVEECHAIINYPYSSPEPKSPNKKKSPKKTPKKTEHEGESTDEEVEALLNIKEEETSSESKMEVAVQAATSPKKSPKTKTETAEEQSVEQYIIENLLPTATKNTPAQDGTFTIFETIYDDCKTMEKLGMSTLAYDVIDTTGQLTKMAMSREENHRDVNYFLWTKYMDVELEQQLSFYVCFMCEQMSTAAGHDRARVRANGMLNLLPGSGILAQQALPTMAVTADAKQIQIRWAKTPPKHRCVPFLMSTVCERLAAMGHIIKRMTEFKDHPE